MMFAQTVVIVFILRICAYLRVDWELRREILVE